MAKRRKTTLDAVVRVREIRERDARIGLHQARLEAEHAMRAQAALDHQLESFVNHTPMLSSGSLFASRAAMGNALAAQQPEVSAARSGAEQIVVMAQESWFAARAAREGVEQLRDRRLAQAEEERRAAEARDLDEMALQSWGKRGANR